MTIYCEPHTPGTLWIAAIHGVVIKRSDELWTIDRPCEFERFCERRGIPTGVIIPEAVYTLAHAAFQASRATLPGALRSKLEHAAWLAGVEKSVAELVRQAMAALDEAAAAHSQERAA
jgi:hypothetical protein